MLRWYVATHRETTEFFVQKVSETNEEFHEQRRRKWNPLDDQTTQDEKISLSVGNPRTSSQAETRTWNYFIPLRTQMELEEGKEEYSRHRLARRVFRTE
jgi:hypothetical protein